VKVPANNNNRIHPTETAKVARVLNWLTFAFAIAPLIYYYIGLNIPIEPGTHSDFGMFRLIFIFFIIASGIGSIVITHINRSKFKSSIQNAQSPGHSALTQAIIAMAFAESIAVYGLVYIFVSGSKEILNICVPVSIALILIIRSRIRIDSPITNNTDYAIREDGKNG